MNHLSLFSGIGGIDLAAEWAGFETIAFCEIDPYCQKVLKKHWPKVPIIGDIRDVTRGKIQETMADTNGSRGARQRNNETDRCSRFISGADPQVLQRKQITLLTGGFPCQPFSQAGKRKGNRDDRYLWPEMLRVIREVKPTWVIGENVGGITNLEVGDSVPDLEGEVPEEVFEHNSVVLDRVCADLEEIGYSVQPFLIPACAVNAPHRRDRVFIVANSVNSKHRRGRRQGGEENKVQGISRETLYPRLSGRTSDKDVAGSNGQGLQGHGGLRERRGQWLTWQGGEPFKGIWESEPNVGRVVNGISARVDRLKCLGNAVVPQQIYPILKAIAEIEGHRRLSYVTK